MPYHRKVTFFRMFMAKIGAFKNIIVPYKLGKEENIPLGFILSTMEGGCPLIRDINKLEKRLRVFGSCKVIGGYRKREDKIISYGKWINSHIVNSIINLGRFLGDKKSFLHL